ncbi:Alpha/Beta hydrolase protein [Ampelomyces quisqualis]|uniref:Alpha/Beta hydrolase protein n=1 Tax=Ampelomyces quisqualis TaxID=50730 RepID=A0A6A5QIZ3_AMPQU|nr:Alpha/Beta hydrolase protein [Ampelomyces quisqualis]
MIAPQIQRFFLFCSQQMCSSSRSSTMKKVILRSLRTTKRPAYPFSVSNVTISSATRVRCESSKTTIGAHQSKNLVSRVPRPTRKTATTSPDYVIAPRDSQFVTLSDGRRIGYAVWGSTSPNAKIVCWPHGLPGSRLSVHSWDQWGKSTGLTFICPERPGYGLSTLKKTYSVFEHAGDIRDLMQHLGHRQYKLFGVSGGGPYALAVARLASQGEVIGVLLVCPTTPPEGPQTGQSIKSFFWEMKLTFLPQLAERDLRNDHEADRKAWIAAPSNEIIRKRPKGAKILAYREGWSAFAGRIADQKAMIRPWGFRLEDVDARKIIILAGGLDENTASLGAQYMRNRLRNSTTIVKPGENHYSMQINHDTCIKESLLGL